MKPDGSPALRDTNIERLSPPVDVLVIGGGINGAVSAAALAARGARVALVERGDFASATSQESSNLVWGGIKYLEGYELGLVRKLCRARNRLLRAYPSSVREVRFFASHPRSFRHARWKLVAGSWLYWALGSFFTRPPRALSTAAMSREEPFVSLDELDGGFEYSDAFLPDGDARFVWGFVRSALDSGCTAINYLEALGSARDGGRWITTARDRVTGRELAISSRLLVNACGPWADEVNARHRIATAHRHVLSKGIHLIVPALAGSDARADGPGRRRVLAFFASDGRLFFAIPMGSRTCIGTTDTPVDRPEVGVTPEDRRFVLDNINRRLRLPRPLTEADVIAERCGVRPLAVDRSGGAVRDWMQLSRRHVVEVDEARGHVTIFGGKLTDCLNVGERICREVRRLGVPLPAPRRRWYGEPAPEVREQFQARARAMRLDELAPGLAEPISERLWRRHGAGAMALAEAIARDPRAAEVVMPSAGVLRCEVSAAARREMVVRLEDFLRRRTEAALVARREDLRRDPGLGEAARILFGDAAEERVREYFGEG
jgi:glycerol-3-phosphate dehydrogenase